MCKRFSQIHTQQNRSLTEKPFEAEHNRDMIKSNLADSGKG
ncbi:hypothetical protein CEV31_0339 [Brucella thiophenivorans]|uniref:Uncharacterized protein n=1 Tax=Brucella thiophenivorans TaxID=571255 RepID=A0A256G6L7_9HYPH|nr:hypothetical protein CEV31_0339 [Brucella thiophenivorans]